MKKYIGERPYKCSECGTALSHSTGGCTPKTGVPQKQHGNFKENILVSKTSLIKKTFFSFIDIRAIRKKYTKKFLQSAYSL